MFYTLNKFQVLDVVTYWKYKTFDAQNITLISLKESTCN